MRAKNPSGRTRKRTILRMLQSDDASSVIARLSEFPPRRVINPLLSFLYQGDQMIKMRAVTVLGAVVARLADRDMESARIILRRLMWNLNDESGGIGWGSPEAMGEILARHGALAEEFAHILLSYAKEGGNFLEHPVLQRGLVWGIGRLSRERPDLTRPAVSNLLPYLSAPDATVRGLAARVLGMLEAQEAIAGLEKLKQDETEIEIFSDERLSRRRIDQLAEEALRLIEEQKNC